MNRTASNPWQAPPRPAVAVALWLLPVVVVGAIYGPPALHAEFISDDWALLLHHQHPGDIVGEWTKSTHLHAQGIDGGYLWRPLTSTVYQVVGETFGRTPTVFRLLNVAIHAVNVLLVTALGNAFARGGGLERGTQAEPTTRGSLLTGCLVALALTVHPLIPDAVGWCADTYDLMAAGFLLLGIAASRSSRALVYLAGPGVALFLALLCKESAVAFSAALVGVLVIFGWWRRAVAVGAVLSGVALVHGRWHHAIVGDFQNSALDLMVWPDFLGLWTDYLRWPLTMPVRAGFTHAVTPGQEPVSVLGVALAVSGLLAWFAAARSRWVGGRTVASAIGVWVVMVSPGAMAAMGFGQQASRYLYMPMVVAWPFLAGAWRGCRRPRILGAVVLVAWILAWAPQAVVRIGQWQSDRTLYLAELRQEPDNPLAQKAVGRLLVQAGQVEPGLDLWEEALEHPPASRFMMDLQQERLDFAVAALQAGQPDRARVRVAQFIADEQAAGREVDESVWRLWERVGGER